MMGGAKRPGILSQCFQWTVQWPMAKAAGMWDGLQVELHGRFSIQRIEDLRDYCNETKWPRVLFLCATTPVPALAVITLLDCIPLSPPDHGCNSNYVYWLRLIPTQVILASCVLHHFRCCLPKLRMSHRDVISVALVSVLAGIGWGYTVSKFVGFPLPFNFVVQSIALVPTLIVALRLTWRRPICENPGLKADLRQQTLVFMGQCTMTCIYLLFYLAFSSMPPLGQSAFTFVLPGINMGLKNYFSHTLQRKDDLKPAFIVFNVDVFSALYVSICLQTTRSWFNTVLIMIVDIIQIAISIFDIRKVLREIRALAPVDRFDGSLLDLCMVATASTSVRRELNRQISSRKFTKRPRNVAPRLTSIVAPMKSETNIKSKSKLEPTSFTVRESILKRTLRPTNRIRLGEKLCSVFFIAEFLLLIEFAEVIIPIIYGIYLSAMSHLSNRAYYPQLAALSDDELARSVSSVMANCGLEFASFLFTLWLLHRELQLSSPHLLAFALEAQQELVHTSITVWLLYVIQQSLSHSGFDFTFRFAWLRSR